MIINMTTFAGRTKHYIDRTLESLFRSDGRDVPLNLILGSSDTSHVEPYRGRANLVPWDEEAEALSGGRGQRQYCNVNALRALRYGDDEHCLCCEDDIIFHAAWFADLMQTIELIDRKDYVLNIALGGDPPPGKRYALDERNSLCGAQGIFYPSKALRTSVADYLQQNIRRSTNDHLVGKYAKQYAVLYKATPALVYHIGQISSFHRPADQGKSEGRPVSPKASPAIPAERGEPKPPDRGAAEARRQLARGPAAAETVLALLRASLGTEPLPDAARLGACNWKRCEQLAAHHGLSAILYRTLRRRAADVPEREFRNFKAHYVANAYRTHVAQVCVQEVGAAFATEQIPVIVMKGAALLRTLYDDPGLRVIGDVDLLVDPNDVEGASAQLQRMGYGLFTGDHEGQRGPLCHIHRVYCRPQPRSIPVELHWRLFEPYQPYVFDLNVVRAQARPFPGLPPNVYTMAPEHELAHLCIHLDRHAVTYRSLVSRRDWQEWLSLPQGLGRLVWLYDIALYLQRRSALIDWDRFVDVARRWAMDDRLYATLELSRRALGVGPPREALEALDRRGPRFVEGIAHRLVLAAYRANELSPAGSPRSGRSLWLSRLSGHAQRLSNTWVSLFPPSAYLRARYDVPSTSLELRGRHLREVVPGLFAEARDRIRAAVATRGDQPTH